MTALLFTVIGFINDKFRGSVLSAMIILYVFLSGFSGYYSSRIYKMLNVIFSFYFLGGILAKKYIINCSFLSRNQYDYIFCVKFLDGDWRVKWSSKRVNTPWTIRDVVRDNCSTNIFRIISRLQIKKNLESMLSKYFYYFLKVDPVPTFIPP